jgi:accessory gene regulator protein AgrB
LSNLVIIVAVGTIRLANLNPVVFVVLGGIGVICILSKAPCQWKTKPISNNEVRKYKKIILLMLVIGIVAIVLLWNISIIMAKLILVGYFVVGFGAVVGSYKNGVK